MNKKMIMRSVVSAIIILLFIFIGTHFYFLLQGKEKESEISLYSLVPQDCLAVLETDNVGNLFHNINKVNYSDKMNAYRASDLLYGLKNNLEALSESKAHGFSKQMSRMVVSFHQPNGNKDQVLYCQLGTGDEAFIENYIQQNASALFPPKTFGYRGEKIHIYPVSATEFLACYYRPEFLVISYQEKLIEKVINTFLDRHSILNDSAFASAAYRNKTHMEATLYIKGKHVKLGDKKEENNTASLTHWAAFDIKLNPDAIYLSGISFDTDTCNSFNNAVKVQEAVENISGNKIPRHTFFLAQFSASDMDALFTQITRKNYPLLLCHTPQERADSALYDYLKQEANHEMRVYIFNESAENDSSHAILSVPLKQTAPAQLKLRRLLRTLPGQARAHSYYYSKSNSYPVYPLPALSIMQSFTGSVSSGLKGCFYKDELLIAPDRAAIESYISQIEKGEVMEGKVIFDECMAALSPESQCLVMADLGKIVCKSGDYGFLLPNYLFRYKEFFRNFFFTAQFTTANGFVYPSLSFTYSGI